MKNIDLRALAKAYHKGELSIEQYRHERKRLLDMLGGLPPDAAVTTLNPRIKILTPTTIPPLADQKLPFNKIAIGAICSLTAIALAFILFQGEEVTQPPPSAKIKTIPSTITRNDTPPQTATQADDLNSGRDIVNAFIESGDWSAESLTKFQEKWNTLNRNEQNFPDRLLHFNIMERSLNQYLAEQTNALENHAAFQVEQYIIDFASQFNLELDPAFLPVDQVEVTVPQPPPAVEVVAKVEQHPPPLKQPAAAPVQEPEPTTVTKEAEVFVAESENRAIQTAAKETDTAPAISPSSSEVKNLVKKGKTTAESEEKAVTAPTMVIIAKTGKNISIPDETETPSISKNGKLIVPENAPAPSPPQKPEPLAKAGNPEETANRISINNEVVIDAPLPEQKSGAPRNSSVPPIDFTAGRKWLILQAPGNYTLQLTKTLLKNDFETTYSEYTDSDIRFITYETREGNSYYLALFGLLDTNGIEPSKVELNDFKTETGSRLPAGLIKKLKGGFIPKKISSLQKYINK